MNTASQSYNNSQTLRYRQVKQYRKRKKSSSPAVIVLIVFVAIVCLAVVLMKLSGRSIKELLHKGYNSQNGGNGSGVVMTTDDETVHREMPAFITAEDTVAETTAANITEVTAGIPFETEAPHVTEHTTLATAPATEPAPPVPELPEAGLVAESDPVGEEYFADALFIGDSRTVGMWMYSGIKDATFYAQQSLNVTTAMTKSFITTASEKEKPANARKTKTLAQALDEENQYKYVYISFGINEFMYMSTTKYISEFRKLVSIVKERLPDAIICVQAVIPLADWKVENTSAYKTAGGNGKIAEYNEGLLAMCEEDGLYYINLCEIFADASGNLCVDSSDGIHFGVSACKQWAEYLTVHAPWYIPEE